ncbi:MAG: ABC transporter substrate-binding protein [Promethearchaeota archaeon]
MKTNRISICIIFIIIFAVFSYNPIKVDNKIEIIEKLRTSGSPIELKYGTYAGPASLDPLNAWDTPSYNVIDQVVERLFTYNLSDPELGIIPSLASDFGTWDLDGLTYRVLLKHGIKFHDGSEFNASAVWWSFERLAYFMNVSGTLPREIHKAYIYSVYQWPNGKPIINSTNIISDYEIEFVLNKKFAPFEALLCFSGSGIMSQVSTPQEEYIDLMTGDLVGTGPFIYDSYDGNEVRFHKFANYRDGPANIDELTFIITSDATQSLLDGDVDFINNIDVSKIEDLKEDVDITFVDAGNTTVGYFLTMNNTEISDPYIRRAISYAIDYNYIINDILEGHYSRLKSPVPNGILYANSTLDFPKLNFTEAREAMQDAGYGIGLDTTYPGIDEDSWEQGEFLTYDYVYNIANIQREELGSMLQNNLTKVGIKIILDGVEWEEFLFRLVERRKLELLLIGWVQDYNDPNNFLYDLYSREGGWNLGVVDDNYLEQLLLDGLNTYDSENRKKIYNTIQEYLVEDSMPYAYLFVPRNYDAYNNEFNGFQSNPMEKLWFHSVYYEYGSQLITTDYTLTSDMYFEEGNGLKIGADGITINGNGHKIIGSGSGSGVLISNYDSVTIKNLTIQGFHTGISIYGGDHNNITINYISDNKIGIILSSTLNEVTNNIIARNTWWGVFANGSSNYIYRNLLINNSHQILAGLNVWVDPINNVGNFWSNYWGNDSDGDYIGDTDLPHEGVDDAPLLDPSIPEKYGPLPYADWWMTGRGGSPIIFQAEDPYGRIINADVNEIGLNAFYIENEDWDEGEDSVMILIAINPEDPIFGTYSYEITATEDTSYSMEYFSSAEGEILFERSVEEVSLDEGQTDQMITVIEETEDPDIGEPIISVRSLEDPIYIDSDDDFETYDFPGSGEEGDPYLIESFYITADNGNLIHIKDTTVYFIIRKCKLDGITQDWDGIYLENIENGIIENNVVINNFHGIVLESSSNSLISDNTLLYNCIGTHISSSFDNRIVCNDLGENDYFGIEIYDSSKNEVINNDVHQNDAGIVLWGGAVNNEIVDNVVYNNQWEGIGLHSSDNNNISHNHIFDCNSGIILYEYSDYNNITWNEINNNYAEGIGLNDDNDFNLVSYNLIYENGVGVTLQDDSGNNDILDNYIINSGWYGIYIASMSSENLIKWNDIIENNEGSCQASDNGFNNLFEYNYWSDWISPDVEDPIGIVDFPYSIDGAALNEDPYPRTSERDNPIQRAQHLIDEVNDMVDEGILRNGQGKSLTIKLDIAIMKIENEQFEVACNILQSFINQIYDFIKDEIISAEIGEVLITKASCIINQIS